MIFFGGFFKNHPGEYCGEASQKVSSQSNHYKVDKSCIKVLLKKKKEKYGEK